MARLVAILRCLFYGFLPPPVECWWRGYVHYFQGGAAEVLSGECLGRYASHLAMNLKEAAILVLLLPLDAEGREFHGLD